MVYEDNEHVDQESFIEAVLGGMTEVAEEVKVGQELKWDRN